MVRVLPYECCKTVCRTAFCQGAGGAEVGADHALLRAEDFARLCHEVYATHDDDVCLRLGSLLRQCQRVAYEVCQVLQCAVGVVVRQDDGILLLG